LVCSIEDALRLNILNVSTSLWQMFLHPFRLSTVDCQLPFLYASSMFGKPRQVETETELYEAAVRALMRRAYSVYEMKQLLGRRTEDDKLLRTVMDRLKRAKMIDDERFAKQFARQRTEIRRQGKFRIARDLRARGVPDRHIEAALADAAKETDEAAIVRQRLERKLRSFRGEIGENKIASMYRSLLRAGFSADVVRRELKEITREEVPEAESQAEE
jgi:regulatory protein